MDFIKEKKFLNKDLKQTKEGENVYVQRQKAIVLCGEVLVREEVEGGGGESKSCSCSGTLTG